MEKEDFERAISSAERQFSYFRIEQVSMRAALDELRRMRDSNEIDAGLYEELQQKYSQRLADLNEKSEQYRRITQSIRHISKYEKDLDVLKQSQQDFIQRLEKTENRLEEERGKVMEMAERFGIVLGVHEPKAAPPAPREAPGWIEKPPAPAPSPEEVSKAESEIERLRKEILAELEKVKTQTKR